MEDCKILVRHILTLPLKGHLKGFQKEIRNETILIYITTLTRMAMRRIIHHYSIQKIAITFQIIYGIFSFYSHFINFYSVQIFCT